MIPCFLNFGTGGLIIIFFAIILLFGAKRIPELARSMGKGISMFKQGMNEAVDQIKETPDAKPSSADSASDNTQTKNEADRK